MLFNLNIRRSLDNRCHACGMNTAGISLVDATMTEAVQGGAKTIKSNITSDSEHDLPRLHIHLAGSSLRFGKKDLRAFGPRVSDTPSC